MKFEIVFKRKLNKVLIQHPHGKSRMPKHLRISKHFHSFPRAEISCLMRENHFELSRQ